MVLRQAALVDLDLVQSITHAAYSPYEPILGGKPLPMTEDYAPRVANGEVWIAEHDGQTVGMMVLEAAETHLTIFSLAVLPAWQGQGVGKWLIQSAEAKAGERGLPTLRLYTSDRMTRNIAIYLQAGFHETGRRPNPYRPGWVMVDMAKPLPMAGSRGNVPTF